MGEHRADRDLLAPEVIAIVDELYRREQCPIPTASIRVMLQERGLWPDRYDRLHALLRTLSRPSPEGVATESRDEPRLKRADDGSPGSLASAFWLPASAPDQCPMTPANSAQALRRAVAAASAALGLPIAKRELGWWAEALPPESPLRKALSSIPLSPLIKNVLDRDERHRGVSGRLHIVTGPLTCHGGPAPRLLVREPIVDEVDACRFADAVTTLRAASETRGISALYRLAIASSSPVLDSIARTRSISIRRTGRGERAAPLVIGPGSTPRWRRELSNGFVRK